METDPSWLYSTIAQSSAAIVAIVGGFITATVLMLTSEKRNLANQKKDKETRLEALKVQERRLNDLYETMRVERFFNSIADDLKKEDELPPLEELLRRYPSWNLDPQILQREYESMSKQKLEAKHFIEEHSDKIDPEKSVSFDQWIEDNKLGVLSYDYALLKDEYYKWRKRKKEILMEEKRKATPPYLQGILERLSAQTFNISPSLLQPTSVILHQQQREERRLEDIKSRITSLRHEISLLENEVSNLNDRLNTFSYPPNLKWGAGVLGYLALAGILLPVQIIANEAFFDWAKTLTLISFGTGIILIFAYIVYQISTLRRKT